MRVENTTAFYPPKMPPTQKLEQAFLEEMMKYMAPKPTACEFSGGVGEEHFTSFLSREYASALSQKFDLGLKVSRDE